MIHIKNELLDITFGVFTFFLPGGKSLSMRFQLLIVMQSHLYIFLKLSVVQESKLI